MTEAPKTNATFCWHCDKCGAKCGMFLDGLLAGWEARYKDAARFEFCPECSETKKSSKPSGKKIVSLVLKPS